MKIKDIMTKDVIFVTGDTVLSKAAELLFQNQLSGMPVVENNKVAGIITEGDLITKYDHVHIPSYIKFLEGFAVGSKCPVDIQKDYQDMLKVKVEDIMSSPVVTINESANIRDLIEIFKTHKGINPVPVVDNEQNLRGVVSRADLVNLFSGLTPLKIPFLKRFALKTLANDICRTFAQTLQTQEAFLFLREHNVYKIKGAYGIKKDLIQSKNIDIDSPLVSYLKKSPLSVISKTQTSLTSKEFQTLFAKQFLNNFTADFIIALRGQWKFIGFLFAGKFLSRAKSFRLFIPFKPKLDLLLPLVRTAGVYLEYLLLQQKFSKEQSKFKQAQQINDYLMAQLNDGVIFIDYQNENIHNINQAFSKLFSLDNYNPVGHKIDDIILQNPQTELALFLEFYKKTKAKRRSFKKELFKNQAIKLNDKKIIINSFFIRGANRDKIGDLIIVNKP